MRQLEGEPHLIAGLTVFIGGGLIVDLVLSHTYSEDRGIQHREAHFAW